MEKLILGLHHITALAKDAQKNVDFYAGILGLRLVKKTINYDAPEVYHLYYGNESGAPGTIMTFFPYPDIPKGKKGNGQLTCTSFSIPPHSIEYWKKRLNQFHISYKGPTTRFDELVLSFEDHEGLGLELVETKKDDRVGYTGGGIPSEYAIKGFCGITLTEECGEKTINLLVNELDHTFIKEENGRSRYSTAQSYPFVDILFNPDALRGIAGYGTVHHVAFATESKETQVKAREKLVKLGLNITPVIDRKYFHSVYFREPGGVLFEIATLLPGFTVDEPLEHLGEALTLPTWEEPNRKAIVEALPNIYG